MKRTRRLIVLLVAIGAVASAQFFVSCQSKVSRWRWAPLRCHVQAFAEIDVGTAIHEDVAVVYYTAKAEFQPLDDGLIGSIHDEASKHKIDQARLPMAEEIGYMLLHDTISDEYHVIIVQERGTVFFLKTEAKFSEPPIFQPLYGRKRQIQVFHSEAIAKQILALKGVRVPNEELPSWIKK